MCVCARCVHGSLCLLVYKCGRDPDLWELQRARCWSRLGHDPGMRFGSINFGLLLRCRSRRTLLVARVVVLAIVLCLNPFLIQAGACGSGKRRPVQDRTKLTACERCRSLFYCACVAFMVFSACLFTFSAGILILGGRSEPGFDAVWVLILAYCLANSFLSVVAPHKSLDVVGGTSYGSGYRALFEPVSCSGRHPRTRAMTTNAGHNEADSFREISILVALCAVQRFRQDCHFDASILPDYGSRPSFGT